MGLKSYPFRDVTVFGLGRQFPSSPSSTGFLFFVKRAGFPFTWKKDCLPGKNELYVSCVTGFWGSGCDVDHTRLGPCNRAVSGSEGLVSGLNTQLHWKLSPADFPISWTSEISRMPIPITQTAQNDSHTNHRPKLPNCR
jgi:hypothetical protein